jgi:mannose-6-phosphate isomerase-like protein (cupin superfamily)
MDHAFALARTVLHLDPDRRLSAAPKDASYWSDRNRRELTCGHLVTLFRYDTTWDYRERHPDGDEFVFLVDGDADVHLGVADRNTVTLVPGDGAIVPAGAWHRLTVRAPSTVLFITPVPARTEHASVAAAPSH